MSLLTEKILTLSEPEFHDTNIQLLRTTLHRNLYPKKLVEEIIEKTKLKFSNSTSTTTSVEAKPIVAVPYAKGLFERLKFACKNDLIIVGKADNCIKKTIFSKIKDKTPTLQQSNLVYQVTCECGVKYVGQTLQMLKSRLGQHRTKINKGDKTHSSLVQHAIEENHKPLWDEVKILRKENVTNRREILETIFIKKTTNCINTQKESIYLASTYNNII